MNLNIRVRHSGISANYSGTGYLISQFKGLSKQSIKRLLAFFRERSYFKVHLFQRHVGLCLVNTSDQAFSSYHSEITGVMIWTGTYIHTCVFLANSFHSLSAQARVDLMDITFYSTSITSKVTQYFLHSFKNVQTYCSSCSPISKYFACMCECKHNFQFKHI